MALRSKSTMRLFLLLGGAVVAGAGTVGWVMHRHDQLRKATLALRPLGMEAYKNGEWVTALYTLGPYLRHYDSDVEVLEAYATVRMKLPEKNDGHLKEVLQVYRRLIALKPANIEYKHQLLRVYGKLQMNTETVQLANQMLDPDKKNSAYGDPNDVEARQRKTAALFALRKFTGEDNALDSAMKTLEVDALAPVATQQILRVMAELGRSPSEMETWGLGQVKGREGPEAAFVEAMAYGFARKNDEAQAAMTRCAAAAPKTAEFAGYVVEMMDKLEMFGAATEYLARNIKTLNDDTLTELYYRRLFYDGQYTRIAQDLAAPEMHSEKSTLLTVLRVMSLSELLAAETAKKPAAADDAAAAAIEARKKEIAALKQSLADRGTKYDFVAADWVPVLTDIYERPAKLRQRDLIETIMDAASRSPDEAFFQVFLGDAYAQSSDSSAAIAHWQAATQLAPSWSRPLMQSAQLYEVTADPETALMLADAANKRQPDQHDIMIIRARAWNASLSRGNGKDVAGLVALLKELHEKYPKEEATLALEVELAAKAKGDKAEAVARLNEILAQDPAVGEPALLRLAVVAFDNQLMSDGKNLQDVVLATAEKAHGLTPQIAGTRAGLMLKHGDRDDAKKYLGEQKDKALQDPKITQELANSWKIAWCRLLETMQDPEATAACESLAYVSKGELSKDPKVLWALLGAPSAWKNREMIGQALDSLENLNGNSGLSWRVEKARWLLEDPDTKRQQEALAFLTDTVHSSPTSPAVRELLAKAYENSDNVSSSATQLETASTLDPQNVTLKLAAARAQLRLGETTRAVPFLKAAAEAANATDLQRLQAGVLLAQSGSADLAMTVLESKTNVNGNTVPLISLDESRGAALTLASLYWEKQDYVRATAAFNDLTAKPTVDIIEQATAYYLARGDKAQAQKTIDKLKSVTAPPGRKLVVEGRYLAQAGDIPGAVVMLQKAVDAMPSSADSWRWLVVSLLSEKDIPNNQNLLDAATQAKRVAGALQVQKDLVTKLKAAKAPARELSEASLALDQMQALADDTALKAMTRGSPELTRMLNTEAGREYLVSCLLLPGPDKGVDEAVRAFSTDEMIKVSPKLQSLADANRDSLPMQVFAIRLLMQTGPKQTALALAERAMGAFPNSPLPAFLASTCYTMNEKYEQAKMAAERWKELAASDAAAPNVAVALNMLALQQSKDAEKLLADMVAAQTDKSKPAYREMLFLLVTSIVQQDRVGEADAMFWPIVQKDENLKDAWARIGADWIRDVGEADAWLKKQQAVTKADDLEGQMRVAVAYYRLGGRMRSPLMAPGDAAKARQQLAEGERLSKQGLSLMEAAVNLPGLETTKMARAALLTGNAFENEGDMAKAEEYYRRSFTGDPKLSPSANNLAMVLAKSADPAKHKEAVTFAATAVGMQSNIAVFHDTLAFTLARDARFDDALKEQKRAVDMEPLNPLWQINLLDILVDSGRMKEAKAASERLEKLTFDPKNFPAEIKARYEKSKAALVKNAA